MEKKEEASIINTYRFVFQSLRSQQKLFIPFIIFALVEISVLILIYLAPRHPFNAVMGPPIRAFWGEKFLHYPANFLLLPKLSSLSRNLLSCLIGSFLTGVAVIMVAEVYFKKTARVFPAFKGAIKKYHLLFALVLVITLMFFGLLKLAGTGLTKYFSSGHSTLLFFKPGVWLGPALIVINLLVVVLVQGSFVYAFPLLMVADEKLFGAVVKSFRLFAKFFFPTIIMIVLPLLIYVPVIVLQFNTPFLIDRVSPESVFYICVAAAIVNSLIVDMLITVSTTTFFLQHKGQL